MNWGRVSNGNPDWVKCSYCGYEMPSSAVREPDRIDHMRKHVAATSINLNTGEIMRVDWCDVKGHAFKAGEPGSQSFTGTVIGEDGTPTQQQMSACADHSFSTQTEASTKPKEMETSNNPRNNPVDFG